MSRQHSDDSEARRATGLPPEGIRWIPCSERQPTEADGDSSGNVLWLVGFGSVGDDGGGELICDSWSLRTSGVDAWCRLQDVRDALFRGIRS